MTNTTSDQQIFAALTARANQIVRDVLRLLEDGKAPKTCALILETGVVVCHIECPCTDAADVRSAYWAVRHGLQPFTNKMVWDAVQAYDAFDAMHAFAQYARRGGHPNSEWYIKNTPFLRSILNIGRYVSTL